MDRGLFDAVVAAWDKYNAAAMAKHTTHDEYIGAFVGATEALNAVALACRDNVNVWRMFIDELAKYYTRKSYHDMPTAMFERAAHVAGIYDEWRKGGYVPPPLSEAEQRAVLMDTLNEYSDLFPSSRK